MGGEFFGSSFLKKKAVANFFCSPHLMPGSQDCFPSLLEISVCNVILKNNIRMKQSLLFFEIFLLTQQFISSSYMCTMAGKILTAWFFGQMK